MPDVCTIILNWNGWRDTVECLESLFALKPAIKTVIVCDNGSTDGSREKILSWAGERYVSNSIIEISQDGFIPKRQAGYSLIYIQNKTNLGFAAGNNVGIRTALSIGGFDFVWILNNDTIVHQRAVKTLLTYAKNHPEMGIFGSTLVLTDRPGILQCAGGCRYNPLTTVYRPALGGDNLETVLSGSKSPKFDYIYGASMFIRTEIFEKIGIFSEDYFLFYEEIDLCRRAKNAGCNMGWCPGSIVYHKFSKTIGRPGLADNKKTALANYHENLSTLIFTKRFHPWLLPLAGGFRFFGKFSCTIKRKDWHLLQPLWRAYLDFFKQHIFNKRPSSQSENPSSAR